MEYRIKIPEPQYTVIRFIQDGHKGVASFNIALRDLSHKLVFGWHLSIMVHIDNVKTDNGMPSQADNAEIEKYEDWLDEKLNPDQVKPNALFLSRVTWNSTIELIWRIHNPEEVNDFLQEVLQERNYPFPFDYRIDPDGDWELADWHLKKSNT
ncbi:MAG: DUF695 domain-containing protein [Bacteroidota bacterium]